MSNSKASRIIKITDGVVCPNCSVLEAGIGSVGLHVEDGYYWMQCGVCRMSGPEDDTKEGAVSLWRNLPQKEDRRKADALDRLERVIRECASYDDYEGWLLLQDPYDSPDYLLYLKAGKPLLDAIEAMEKP